MQLPRPLNIQESSYDHHSSPVIGKYRAIFVKRQKVSLKIVMFSVVGEEIQGASARLRFSVSRLSLMRYGESETIFGILGTNAFR